MPFTTAPMTSPCSWEPYLSNNVQNTNNNPPECHQPVKTKWVVDVLQLQMKLWHPRPFCEHTRYTSKCTSCPILTNSIGLVSTGHLQKNDLIPSELVC